MGSIMSTPMSEHLQRMQQNNPQQMQSNEYDDAVSKAIAMAQSGANMENEFKNAISQNPTKAQQFAQFMQQNKGRNVWDIAYDLMAQRGINPSTYGLPPRK